MDTDEPVPHRGDQVGFYAARSALLDYLRECGEESNGEIDPQTAIRLSRALSERISALARLGLYVHDVGKVEIDDHKPNR